MAEFDEKLNAILSDPGAMSQIMELAQSLGGGAGNPASAASPPVSDRSTSSSGSDSPIDLQLMSKLMPLLQELGGQQDSNARALLYALRPYLKEERQTKVDRAVQLARLFHLGKQFLAGWGKQHV